MMSTMKSKSSFLRRTTSAGPPFFRAKSRFKVISAIFRADKAQREIFEKIKNHAV